VEPDSVKTMDRKESDMKILVVSPSYWPATDLGGPIFSLHALNKMLVKKSVDVTVYTTDIRLKGKVASNREAIVDGVKVTYFSFSPFFEFLGPTGWQFSVPMRKALEKNIKDFELVYILSVWNYPVIMAASVCRRFNKPYVISPRGLLCPWPFERKFFKKWVYYKLLAEKCIRKADAIHYTSSDEREKSHERLGLGNKVILVPNGIDLHEFNSLPLKNELVIKYPALKDKRVILFLGRINPKKGIDILIKAFSMLSKKRKDLRLVITGKDEEGYKSRIVRLIRKLRLQDKVIFTDMLLGREKLKVYAGSDIFVLASHSENFGMSAIEAMASGLAVVISDNVGIYRDVEENDAGIIAKTSAKSIYNGIMKLLEDEGLRKKISQNGKSFVREFYSIDKVADKMIEELEGILRVSR